MTISQPGKKRKPMPAQLSRWLTWVESWLRPVTRERLVFWGGILALLAAAGKPWYHLPVDTLDAFGVRLMSVNLLKGLTLAIVGSGTVCILIGAQKLSRFLVWQALGLVLLTPYILTTWTPTLDAVTTNLYEQNQKITHHVEQNLPTVQAQWKRNIPLLPDRTPPSTFGLTIPDSRFFQPASWDYLFLEGLGYRNSFFAFVGKGWILSLVGLVFSLLGLYVRKLNSSALLSDLRWLIPQVSSILGLIFLSIFGVNLLNFQLESWLVEGNYPVVISVSRAVEVWYPPLKFDEEFQNQWAQAEFYAGSSDSFRVNLAKGVEQYRWGEYAGAVAYFQQALKRNPNSFLARKYLAIALLNGAVDYFETPILPNRPSQVRFPSRSNFLDSPKARQGPIRAKPTGAIAQFEQVLSIFPGHLEALYNLMLAHSINGDFDQSAAAAQQLIHIQSYFQQPNTALLGQAYNHLTWKEYHNNDLETAWERYRQSVDPSRWP